MFQFTIARISKQPNGPPTEEGTEKTEEGTEKHCPKGTKCSHL